MEDIERDIETVDICPDLTPKTGAHIRTLLKRYEHVFEGGQTTLPKPFAAEPIELKFVNDPVPQAVPEPRWTFTQLSTSRWASRPHIVMKTPAQVHKDHVDLSKCKLRVCGDYRKVNSQICKIVPNLPTGLDEVERAAGHKLYWESDSVACYS